MRIKMTIYLSNSSIDNFPFPTLREKQAYVLNDSGYKRIVLEASPGFGKSGVATASALILGLSYICVSTIGF